LSVVGNLPIRMEPHTDQPLLAYYLGSWLPLQTGGLCEAVGIGFLQSARPTVLIQTVLHEWPFVLSAIIPPHIIKLSAEEIRSSRRLLPGKFRCFPSFLMSMALSKSTWLTRMRLPEFKYLAR